MSSIFTYRLVFSLLTFVINSHINLLFSMKINIFTILSLILSLNMCLTSIYAKSVVMSNNYHNLPILNNKFNSKHYINDNIIYNYLLIKGGKSSDSIFSINYWISKFKALLFGSKKSNIKVKESKKSKETTDSNKSKSSKQSNSNSVESGPNARLLREIKEFTSNPPAGCSLKVGKNIRQWIVTIQGAKDTIYEGEEYNLKMIFSKDYPSKPPTVYFLKPCPKHVHVYSNGDICLNLLGRDWRPGMTAESVAISILSMLSSAKEKKIPPDNALHSDNAPGMQQDNWMYHDDKC